MLGDSPGGPGGPGGGLGGNSNVTGILESALGCRFNPTSQSSGAAEKVATGSVLVPLSGSAVPMRCSRQVHDLRCQLWGQRLRLVPLATGNGYEDHAEFDIRDPVQGVVLWQRTMRLCRVNVSPASQHGGPTGMVEDGEGGGKSGAGGHRSGREGAAAANSLVELSKQLGLIM